MFASRESSQPRGRPKLARLEALNDLEAEIQAFRDVLADHTKNASAGSSPCEESWAQHDAAWRRVLRALGVAVRRGNIEHQVVTKLVAGLRSVDEHDALRSLRTRAESGLRRMNRLDLWIAYHFTRLWDESEPSWKCARNALINLAKDGETVPSKDECAGHPCPDEAVRGSSEGTRRVPNPRDVKVAAIAAKWQRERAQGEGQKMPRAEPRPQETSSNGESCKPIVVLTMVEQKELLRRLQASEQAFQKWIARLGMPAEVRDRETSAREYRRSEPHITQLPTTPLSRLTGLPNVSPRQESSNARHRAHTNLPTNSVFRNPPSGDFVRRPPSQERARARNDAREHERQSDSHTGRVGEQGRGQEDPAGRQHGSLRPIGPGPD
jgi:hypothetical protein